MKKDIIFLLTALFIMAQLPVIAQTDTTTYHLTLRLEKVNKAGEEVTGITVNGSIPGPTLRFTEGGYAVIFVKNEMDVETSVHWNGILLMKLSGMPVPNTCYQKISL